MVRTILTLTLIALYHLNPNPSPNPNTLTLSAGIYLGYETVIVELIERMQAGDVMLIELQHSFKPRAGIDATWAPVEYYPAGWAAIRAAVDKGIVVIEAGANGHMDLDAVHEQHVPGAPRACPGPRQP